MIYGWVPNCEWNSLNDDKYKRKSVTSTVTELI